MHVRNDRTAVRTLGLVLLVLGVPAGAHAAPSDEACRPVRAVPTSIRLPGNYCLTGDLLMNGSAGAAVVIAADSVVLDLAGFTLGAAPSKIASRATGIYARNRSDVTIRNGTLRGFERGLLLVGPSSARNLVEGLLVVGSGSAGITVQGWGNIVRDSQVADTGGTGRTAAAAETDGIRVVGPLSRVLNSQVRDTSPPAVGAGRSICLDKADGAVVEGNRIRNDQVPPGSVGIDVLAGRDVLLVGNDIGATDVGVQSGTTDVKQQGNATPDSPPASGSPEEEQPCPPG